MMADDPKRATNHVVRCSFWVVSHHPTKQYDHANRCIGFSTRNEVLRDDDPDRPPFVTIGDRGRSPLSAHPAWGAGNSVRPMTLLFLLPPGDIRRQTGGSLEHEAISELASGIAIVPLLTVQIHRLLSARLTWRLAITSIDYRLRTARWKGSLGILQALQTLQCCLRLSISDTQALISCKLNCLALDNDSDPYASAQISELPTQLTILSFQSIH